jgi:hypothetical protein
VEEARALAWLRETVRLIGDERRLADWGAYGAQSGPGVLGLFLVTDQRLVFVDAGGGLMAFPILKISMASVTSPCQITLTTWFGRMSLTFATPDALNSMLNLVRHDPMWVAVESNLVRPRFEQNGVHLVDTCGGRASVRPSDRLSSVGNLAETGAPLVAA